MFMTRRKKPAGPPTKTQRNAIDLYNRANTNHDEFIAKIGAVGLLANALNSMEKWYYQRGSSCMDCHIKIWIKKNPRPLFTTNSINRLLSLLHKNYSTVVLVKFIIVCDDGRLLEEKDD